MIIVLQHSFHVFLGVMSSTLSRINQKILTRLFAQTSSCIYRVWYIMRIFLISVSWRKIASASTRVLSFLDSVVKTSWSLAFSKPQVWKNCHKSRISRSRSSCVISLCLVQCLVNLMFSYAPESDFQCSFMSICLTKYSTCDWRKNLVVVVVRLVRERKYMSSFGV